VQTYTVISSIPPELSLRTDHVVLTGRNDAPVIALAATTPYVLGSAAVAVAPGAKITDVDSLNFRDRDAHGEG